jgi:elongator complex protein 1
MNDVCDAFKSILLQKDAKKYSSYANFRYLPTVLVSYMRRQPPDLNNTIKVLMTLKGQDGFDEAVDFAVYMGEVDELYKTALRLYDLELALAILQRSHQVIG